MAVFFFVVGLEIKRELVLGDLSNPRAAALPVVAALGGMLVPALIYIAFNAGAGAEAARGWGIPMATDIAFAVGVISLLGRRVPAGGKLFILALAIADDIGAIAVIAVFYTTDLDMDSAAPRAHERIDQDAREPAVIAKESVAPLDRLESALHPWSSFLIVPVFALANAGVRFVEIDMVEAVTSSVSLGAAFGLVVGKVLGMTTATAIAVRLGIGTLPRRTGRRQIVGLGALAGVGFTVSLFVTELAFTGEELTEAAKIGIFGSTVAGVAASGRTGTRSGDHRLTRP
jgi:Na+:H+ antiporter, NhaA family